jgi:flagellar hook-associated protein 1 FlgK
VSDLLSALVSTAGALNAFDSVFAVTQNNVANASTPGFVKQQQTLEAMLFGGVRAGDIQNARDRYADQAVRSETTLLGQAQQNVTSLTSLQNAFDISGNSGIPNALGYLWNAFSAWSTSPDSTVARQTVLSNAQDVAQAFQRTLQNLNGMARDAEQQIGHTVDQINYLAGQLQHDNSEVLTGGRNNAALDAQLHSTLEQLAQYARFTAIEQSDGTVSVLLNGETPLVLGDRQYPLTVVQAQPASPPVTNPTGRAQVRILASDGSDITGNAAGGQLGALLDFRNRLLASYLGDGYQQGDLNRLAQGLADRVNQLLTSGSISDGPPAQAGVALFTYDLANPSNVAATLSVAAGMTPDQLAAIDPGPPYSSNGTAQALAGLENPQTPADGIDGDSYVQFYGMLAARAGTALSNANNDLAVQQSAVAQAKSLQQQVSGVSLDQEATTLIQFQRAYEANARLLTVLNQLTEDMINILPPY